MEEKICMKAGSDDNNNTTNILFCISIHMFSFPLILLNLINVLSFIIKFSLALFQQSFLCSHSQISLVLLSQVSTKKS